MFSSLQLFLLGATIPNCQKPEVFLACLGVETSLSVLANLAKWENFARLPGHHRVERAYRPACGDCVSHSWQRGRKVFRQQPIQQCKRINSTWVGWLRECRPSSCDYGVDDAGLELMFLLCTYTIIVWCFGGSSQTSLCGTSCDNGKLADRIMPDASLFVLVLVLLAAFIM